MTNVCHCRGFADECRDALELDLPDSLDELHRQFCLHKTTLASAESHHSAVSLRTVDDVHSSVLQNFIVVGNVFFVILHSSRN